MGERWVPSSVHWPREKNKVTFLECFMTGFSHLCSEKFAKDAFVCSPSLHAIKTQHFCHVELNSSTEFDRCVV